MLSRRIEPIAQRLVAAIVLVCGVGFVLGFVHALGPLGCWIAVALPAAFRAVRFRALPLSDDPPPPSPVGYAAVLAATAYGAWPSLVRPLTDGDTLIYHFPNAVAWVRAHSVFVTDTHYWWYPGASELFAAVMFSVGGLPLVPVAGACAYALLGLTSIDWCRKRGLSDLNAAALTLALLTAFVAIVQSGDLQNDVWLAAFFGAGLYRLEWGRPASNGLLATLALLKPIGWIFAAALALGAPRGARRIPWLALGVLAAWILRDAILARGAIVPLPPFPDPAQSGTSIAAHGFEGLRVLFTSAFRDGLATSVLLAASLACALGSSRTRLGAAAILAWVVLLLVPFGFTSDGIPQLALGFTLRFALPALVVGLFALAGRLALGPTLLRRVAFGASVLAVAAGAEKYLALYWNDASTHAMGAVALATFVLALGAALQRAAIAPAVLCAGALAFAFAFAWHTQRAQSATAYYRDALGESGSTSPLPEYLARLPETTVVTVGFPLGMFAILQPRAHGIDGLYAGDVCAQARALHALLVVHLAGATGAGIRASLAGCGPIVWRNGGSDEALAPGTGYPSR